MSIITKMRRQKAVYWKRGEPDEFGKFGFEDPVEIDCRWEGQVGSVRNEKGELVSSKGTVYVDRKMYLGDMLKQGEMDSDTPVDPSGQPEIFEIQGFEEIPNFKATETLYIAHL